LDGGSRNGPPRGGHALPHGRGHPGEVRAALQPESSDHGFGPPPALFGAEAANLAVPDARHSGARSVEKREADI